MKQLLGSLVILLTLSSCIKTAEQVNRERQFSNMSSQLTDSQALVGKIMSQLNDMQSQIETVTGRIEEIEHKQSLVNPAKFKENSEDVIMLKTKAEALQNQIESLQQELKVQKEYIEKVTDGLKSLKQAKAAPAPAPMNSKQKMEDALEMVSKNKYVEAKRVLETLIDHKDLSPADHNKVYHGLGRAELYTNNADKALVYLSKIVMNYPKSSLAPNSLYLIGKAFQKQNKKEEARQAFSKVVADYPTSRDAERAKKEL